jgi:tripartite-type tricarboxylate transporter receptor subunit TctC
MASLKDVPTIAETLPGFESAAWYAVVAPPRTPATVVNKVNAAINEALRDPDVQKRLEDLSAEAVGGTPQETAAYLKQEVERWKNVIVSAHVTLD